MIDDILRYIAQGIPLGCVYALVALGLVLTYKTSGVFNLAFGAQAFLSSAIYNALRTDEHWGIVPAAIVAVLVAAPIVGVLLDRCLFRYLRSAVWQVKLVTALGLLTGLPEVIKLAFGDQPVINPPGLAPDPRHGFSILAGQVWNENELVAVVATVAVVVGLGLLFRYTALGLQMRGIVESPRMVELAGVDSERVGMAAWILSSLLAGLAGVLLAPLYGQLDANSFTLLLVVAISAAVVGRLTSLPIALAGALGLGIAQQVVAGEIDPNSPSEIVRVLYQGLRPSLPFVVLFLFLVLSPAIRHRREVTDPLRGVDPPPPNLAVTYQDKRLRRINLVVFPTFVILVIAATQWWLSGLWVARLTDGIVLAVTLLSITVITGLAGQISLAQASFSGLGVFAAAQLAASHGFPMIWAMLGGALLAAVIGGLIAIPSLRLGGIYLTLATLAAALFADNIVFQWDPFTGGTNGIPACVLPGDKHCIKPANVFGLDVSSDRTFFLFAFAVFAVVGLLVILVRKGTTGRYLAAIRGSEVAAPSIGINPTAARIRVFALSAGIAGLGGGLYAMFYAGTSNIGTIYEGDLRYNTLFGFLLVVLVVSLGARTVDGAVNAALGFVLFPLLLADELGLPDNWAVIGFAFGAITYARHPEGIVEFQKLRSIRAQISHRAVSARTRALEVTGAIGRRLDPTAMVAIAAAPAVLLLAAFGITATHLGTDEVFAYGAVLIGGAGFVALRAQRELREVGEEPLPMGVGLLLLAAGGVGLLLALPEVIGRIARRRYVPVDASWITGVFPVFTLGLNVYLQLQRPGDTPSELGWGLILFLGTVAVLGWLSTILWGIRETCVAMKEQAAAPHPTPTAAPDALATAPPGAG